MSTQKNEHNPDNLSRKQVGEGWRILGPNERQQRGDEWWNDATNKWEANHEKDIGRRVYGDGTWYITYRRRITPPTDTAGSGREGETVEMDRFTYESFKQCKNDCDADEVWAHTNRIIVKAKEIERQRDAARKALQSIAMLPLNSEPRAMFDRAQEIATKALLAAIDSAQRQEGR